MKTSSTTVKNIDVSVRKVRMLLPNIRVLSPVDALRVISVLPHSAAQSLHKVLKNAIHNAVFQLKMDENMLQFHAISVDQGMVLKRYRAGSRGTARPILRRRSHITIVLKSLSGDLSDTKKEKNMQKEDIKTTHKKVSAGTSSKKSVKHS